MKLLCIALLLVGAVSTQRVKQGLRVTKELASTLCHITLECISTRSEPSSKQHHQTCHFECSPVKHGDVSDISYSIDLPTNFANSNKKAIHEGSFFATVAEALIVNGAIVLPTNNSISVGVAPQSFHRRRRRLVAASGNRSLLVVRVSSNDATPGFTAQEIFDFVFSDSQPMAQPSLKSQYSKLSFGKLNFVPAQNGVVDVNVSMNANEATSTAIRDAAITILQSKYGVSSITSLADHVMICIPPGTGDWVGVSVLNSWRLVLNDQWCGYISGTIHEMGHNLGLLHANRYGITYMDFTSYMSAGYGVPYYPVKSFNGANNWQLGWYSDRQMTIDPSQGGQKVTLATFVDYDKSDKSNPVLVKVGNDTYLQYNRAKGFNYQAAMSIDQVTIVQQQNVGTSLLGSVDPTHAKVTLSNFGGSGRDLVIVACSKGAGNSTNPDWMTISIGYDQNYCFQVGTPTSSKVTIDIPTGMCFSEHNTVEVESKGTIFMKDLRIGDLVKNADGKFSKVFSFGHYNANQKADFLQIHAHGLLTPLEITRDHLLFVHGIAVPASTIVVGDKIDVSDGRAVAEVTMIQSVIRSGVYAPFTTSGTIVVSGVAASCYVTLQNGSGFFVIGNYKTPLPMHWLSHIFLSPHRLICWTVGGSCTSDTYTESGISQWVEYPWYLSNWLLQQHHFVMILGLLVALSVVLVIFLLELVMCSSVGFILTGLALSLFITDYMKLTRSKTV